MVEEEREREREREEPSRAEPLNALPEAEDSGWSGVMQAPIQLLLTIR